MKALFLDTESNGQPPEQLCQLSFIYQDQEPEAHNYFFSVDTMNPYAQKVHGFSKMRLFHLSNGKSFSDRIEALIDPFLSAEIVIGHNIQSDMRLIHMEFERNDIRLPKYQYLDTMTYFQQSLHLRTKTGKRKQPNLKELCKYFQLNEEEILKTCCKLFHKLNIHAHDARFDAAAVYLCVLIATQRGDIKGVIQ